MPESPCLNLSVARLSTSGTENFAIWVMKAPYSAGYVFHDCLWPQSLADSWQAWQELFAPESLLQVSPVTVVMLRLFPTISLEIFLASEPWS